MVTRSILLVGGPDSGKTNFLARLWPALDGSGQLEAKSVPDNLKYVLDNLNFMLSGEFAPRTQKKGDQAQLDEFVVDIGYSNGRAGGDARIIAPDVTGELWENAVVTSEISTDWMARIRDADGALLFVRVHSQLNVDPLDWVTAEKLLQLQNEDTGSDSHLPTQVFLSELLRFLEHSLKRTTAKPKVAVLITAWDLLDAGTQNAGPNAYLQNQYPLFAGRLKHTEELDVRIYGISIVGGDLNADEVFREQFLKKGLEGSGYIATDVQGSTSISADLTLPLNWLLSAG
ncbi:MAG: hypothetical protein JSR78_07380 [Proteobacteria bacterium]|nr:hypothetical protein [Pseudomonadota bacterium]